MLSFKYQVKREPEKAKGSTLTMGTPNNDIQQIRAMFQEAVQRTTKLVKDIDTEELTLLRSMYSLFREAVRAVVPVLKYLDQKLPDINGISVRGIMISDGLMLIRGGRLQWKNSALPWMDSTDASFGPAQLDLNESGLVDVGSQVAQLIEMLTVLGEKFAEALAKADERRAKLAERSSQLQKAAEAFKA